MSLLDVPASPVPSSAAELDNDTDSEVSVDLEFESHHHDNDFVEGPLEPIVPTEQLSRDPLPIPVAGLVWDTLDLTQPNQMRELWNFLFLNYVEDADEEFRFDYSVECLAWALLPPGYHKDWHLALRNESTRALIGFVSGVPLQVRIRQTLLQTCEINFLCVHPEYRKKRLTPTLLAEISRRAQLRGIIQHLYTAAAKLPRIISVSQYYHRAINVRKLIDVGFSSLPLNTTIESQIEHYSLPSKTSIPNLREMCESDVSSVTRLWNAYSTRFTSAVKFSEEDTRHYFLSARGSGGDNQPRRPGQTVWAYVIDDATDGVTDFVSFYAVGTSVLKYAEKARAEGVKQSDLEGAAGNHVLDCSYLFYYASSLGIGANVDEERLAVRVRELVKDALVIAARAGFDVLNCITAMDNAAFLDDEARECKFVPGTGILHWYLDGYRTHTLASMHATEDTTVGRGIGIVMI